MGADRRAVGWRDHRWRRRAACAGLGAEHFVFDDASGSPALMEAVARAKAICADCPVRSACLEFAIATRQEGIWGATTTVERRVLRRRRRRQQAESVARAELDVGVDQARGSATRSGAGP
ncbi:MAG TPA: WhiB family transcriptional regulator [Acidimicrobiales bacterium]|nr:WhiB family transcriptional regulator [Acidimicrobiales bacterium]